MKLRFDSLLVALTVLSSLSTGGKAQTTDEKTVSASVNQGLTPDDERAIRGAIEAFRTAWLANDAKRVLKTFSDDAVVLPDHGAPAVVGIAAIEKYWFAPGGPPTIITDLKITVDQVGGNRALAYARGLDFVAWTVGKHGATRKRSHPGTYLNVMQKLPDGSWKIAVHMWDNGPEQVE